MFPRGLELKHYDICGETLPTTSALNVGFFGFLFVSLLFKPSQIHIAYGICHGWTLALTEHVNKLRFDSRMISIYRFNNDYELLI